MLEPSQTACHPALGGVDGVPHDVDAGVAALRDRLGALRIVDYTAAVVFANASREPCLRGANREGFVERNACFHLDASTGPRAPDDETDSQSVNPLAEAVGQRWVVASAGVVRTGASLVGPYACFAKLCFPRLSRAVRLTQTQRGTLASAEACLARLGAP